MNVYEKEIVNPSNQLPVDILNVEASTSKSSTLPNCCKTNINDEMPSCSSKRKLEITKDSETSFRFRPKKTKGSHGALKSAKSKKEFPTIEFCSSPEDVNEQFYLMCALYQAYTDSNFKNDIKPKSTTKRKTAETPNDIINFKYFSPHLLKPCPTKKNKSTISTGSDDVVKFNVVEATPPDLYIPIKQSNTTYSLEKYFIESTYVPELKHQLIQKYKYQKMFELQTNDLTDEQKTEAKNKAHKAFRNIPKSTQQVCLGFTVYKKDKTDGQYKQYTDTKYSNIITNTKKKEFSIKSVCCKTATQGDTVTILINGLENSEVEVQLSKTKSLNTIWNTRISSDKIEVHETSAILFKMPNIDLNENDGSEVNCLVEVIRVRDNFIPDPGHIIYTKPKSLATTKEFATS